MTEIFLQDVTLRDGMHAIRHRIDPEDVKRIVAALDAAGVDAIEVAHGDGLAGGTLNYGPGSHSDWEWIEAAASVLKNARLTTLLLPGVGTIEELRTAWDLGVRSVRIATHCTEADVAKQHIETAREIGMDVSGFLMMSHMAPSAELAQQAKLMESYGAHCVYVTDSGGRLTMDGVRERIRAYKDVLDPTTELGIHAHENLSLSVANSVVAVENGVFRGEGDRSASLAAVAEAAREAGQEGLFGEVDNPLDLVTFPNGCQVAEVEIDPETGHLTLERYVAVDDYGTLINPLLTEGQVQGGLAQGIGQALHERTFYDPSTGQLLTASLMDYGLPRAADLPDIEVRFNPVPSAANPLGVKGSGQAGCIGAPQTIMLAILDALAPLGVESLDMPATPERLWRAIQGRAAAA